MTAYRELSSRAPGRPWASLAWYETARRICAMFGWLGFGLRVHGTEHIPATGAVIFVSNHQSFLDPILCGVATGARPSRPMARESLFRFPPMGWLLRSVGTVPVRMDGGAMAALRVALQELQAGRAVTLFPEGTRSADGTLAAFRPGMALLVRKGGAAIVPVAIDGAFQAWPKHRALPRICRPVCVEIGEPIPAEEAGTWFKEDADAALERVRERVAEALERARHRRAIMRGER